MDKIDYQTIVNKKIKDNIIDLHLNDKNIELKIIVLQKLRYFKKGNYEIYTFLVVDKTASVFCNFYRNGNLIQEGDILYVSGYFNSIFKKNLYLNQGKESNTFKIGTYFFNFNNEINISEKVWDFDNKKGLKFN